MPEFVIVTLFFAMLLFPCVVASRSARGERSATPALTDAGSASKPLRSTRH